jgi:hypothetical protein
VVPFARSGCADCWIASRRGRLGKLSDSSKPDLNSDGVAPRITGTFVDLALEMTSHERPDAEKTGVDVYNLAHPKPVRWNMIMSTISSKLHLPQSTPISYSAWLEKLRELGKANTSGNIGALTLFPFFESVAGNMTEGAKEGAVGVTMALQKAKQASKTLAGDDSVLPPLSEVDVESWIGYWRRAGLLD